MRVNRVREGEEMLAEVWEQTVHLRDTLRMGVGPRRRNFNPKPYIHAKLHDSSAVGSKSSECVKKNAFTVNRKVQWDIKQVKSVIFL